MMLEGLRDLTSQPKEIKEGGECLDRALQWVHFLPYAPLQ